MKPAHTPQLRDTQEAFDSVAVDYDGPRGNNVLIQEMRHEMWRWLDATFAPGSRLIWAAALALMPSAWRKSDITLSSA